MLKLSLPARANLNRLVFETAMSALCGALVILSICKPGHISRQVDLMSAGALIVLYMLSRPTPPVGILVAVIVFIPAYALPPIGVFPGSPPALVCLLVAIVLVLSPRRTRSRAVMTPLDWMLALLMLLMLISVLTGIREMLSWTQNGIEWVAPFACGRMLGVTSKLRERLARVISVSGAVLACFVLVEAVTSFNPFSKYLDHSLAYGFVSSYLRSGVSRTNGSFGDPIALSMFFATAIVLCIALILDAKTNRQRRGWSVACLLMLAAQFTTVSRTAWLMLAVALVYAAIALPDLRARRRLQVLCVCGLVAVVLLGQFGPTSISSGIPIVGTTNSETTASANYRSGLLRAAQHDTSLRPFGTKQSTLNGKVVANYGSIDDEYLNLMDGYGYIPAAVLTAMFPLLVLMAFLYRPTRNIDVFYIAAALASFVALVTVAFITQQQVVFWLLIGIVSGLFASRRVITVDGRLLSNP